MKKALTALASCSSVVAITLMLLSNNAFSRGTSQVNTYSQPQIGAMNKAADALNIIFAQLALYYKENGQVPPANEFKKTLPKGGVISKLTNDNMGMAELTFGSVGPKCLQNQTVKMMPGYSLNSENKVVVDYASKQCITTIDSKGTTSCSPIPTFTETKQYNVAQSTLGTELTNCRVVFAENINLTSE